MPPAEGLEIATRGDFVVHPVIISDDTPTVSLLVHPAGLEPATF